MSAQPSQMLTAAVGRLLRPLVRMLLRRGISFGAFAEIARWVYVDVALGEFGMPGRKPSQSRASLLTGLTRKEVQRLRDLPAPGDEPVVERYNRAARVLTAWIREPEFSVEGEPTPLAVDGPGATFAELVRRHSGDVPVRAVLDELVRVGAVELGADGCLHLLTRGYVPTAEAGEADKLGILGTDVAALIATIDHNIESSKEHAFFQRKVAYSGVRGESVPAFRRFSAQKAQALLEELDCLLARQAKCGGDSGKKVMVGIYYFEEDEDRTDSAASQKASGRPRRQRVEKAKQVSA